MKTNTKKKLKASIVTLCALILVFASVVGTLAYLTDYETVTNTFTVGKVDITLDEAKVDADGHMLTGEDASRVTGNSYQLIPGRTIDKDPTVTVKGDSEACYVRMIVQVTNYSKMVEAFEFYDGTDGKPCYYLNTNEENMVLLHELVGGWLNETWAFSSFNKDNGTYEFRYVKTDTVAESQTDTVLAPLFTTVTIPGILTNSEMQALQTVEITVTAHAIQAEGFDNAGEAWAAWGSIRAEKYEAPANNG